MRKLLIVLFYALLVSGCVSISLFPQKMPLREKTVQGTGADKVLLLSISGIIAEGKDGGLLDRDNDLVARIKEELTLAAEDEHIKALLFDLEGMKKILGDAKVCTVRLVLNLEKMVIKEAQRAYTYLNLYDYQTDAVIVNRVLPELFTGIRLSIGFAWTTIVRPRRSLSEVTLWGAQISMHPA